MLVFKSRGFYVNVNDKRFYGITEAEWIRPRARRLWNDFLIPKPILQITRHDLKIYDKLRLIVDSVYTMSPIYNIFQ
mgnify:CR=1 FL=1